MVCTKYPIRFTASGLLLAISLLLTTATAQAQDLLPLGGVAQISAGDIHSCALTTNGKAKCWGRSNLVGDGSATDLWPPPQPFAVNVQGLNGTATAISAGGHTCALTPSVGTTPPSNGAKCWGGDNEYGQIGDASYGVPRLLPRNVWSMGSGAAAISAGYRHTCALSVYGAVRCWGRGGVIGDGSQTTWPYPREVQGLGAGVAAISAGRAHSCVLTTLGGVKCWGSRQYGALGDGNTHPQSLVPVDVQSLNSMAAAVDTGWFQTCVLTTDNGVKCWGAKYGQPGNVPPTSLPAPTDVPGLTSGVTAISVGDEHACALTAAGEVKCWGNNHYGQLGDGTTTNRTLPTNVLGLSSGVAAISAGGYHTCAVTTSGEAKCWGYNYLGQLGDGTTADRPTPVNVLTTPPGSDARLSDLILNTGNNLLPAFAPDTLAYKAILGDWIDYISFRPTASDPEASITLNGQPLASGSQSFSQWPSVCGDIYTLRVTAADGITRRDYRIEVPRRSAPAELHVDIERLPGEAGKDAAETRQYRLGVLNLGTESTQGVVLRAPLPVGLTNLEWACEPLAGCEPPGAGSNVPVDATFDLAPDASMNVDLVGDVLPGAAFVDIAIVAADSCGTVQVRKTLSEAANGLGVMKNGFEE